MSGQVISEQQAKDAQRARIRSGIPLAVDTSVAWPKRFLTNPRTWLTVVLLVLYVACLYNMYLQVVPDKEVPGGTLLGMGREVIPKAAGYAAISLIPLTVLFVLVDRYRPQRLWIWLMTLGWGACVATFASLVLNTWAAGKLEIAGDGDPASAARAAIYVAPFVEESMKATVLFWIAILMRYQFVSRLSGVALAGLSAAGFAFTENILYYGRAYRFAAQTYGQADPEEVIRQIFQIRGLMTPYGHPMFTMMTGLGIAIAVRHKSKVVRILAPLAGFLAAAFLHMSFNATGSLVGMPMLLVMWAVSLVFVATLVVMVVTWVRAESRLIGQRLTDYVDAGWLLPEDVRSFSRARTRARALWQALWHGPRTFWATVSIQREMSELAYLRDAMVRGIVDAAGRERARELLTAIALHRARAVTVPAARAPYPRFSLGRRGQAAPQGEIQSWPAPDPSWAPPTPASSAPGAAPLGSTGTRYSEVDPSWRPPGQ